MRAEDVERLFEPSERRQAADWLAKQERGELYVAVAEVDGVPVGRMCLDLARFGDRGIGYCYAGSVRPRWRSRGIGSLIVRHVEQVARARGMHALRSRVAKSNEHAVRWHERQGGRRTGEDVERYTSGVHGGEVVVDCWMFERQLTRTRRVCEHMFDALRRASLPFGLLVPRRGVASGRARQYSRRPKS